MKRFWSALLCVLIILNMTACGLLEPETTSQAPPVSSSAPETTKETEPETTEPEQETEAVLDVKAAPKIYTKKYYSLCVPTQEDPERIIYLNAQGELLENVTIPTALRDAVTGKLRYYTVAEYNKDGSLKASWLYSSKGKALEGSGNCIYGDCLGTLVVKRLQPGAGRLDADGLPAAEVCWLYDPSEKALAAENICSIERLTDKTAVCLDSKRHILGVYDAKGEKILDDPFEGQFAYGYGCGEYILGYPGSGSAVLNKDLEIIAASEKMFDMDLYDCGAQGVLCVIKENDFYYIFRTSDAKLLGTFSSDFLATDGINVICGDERELDVDLHSMRGKRLAGPFDKISLLRDGNDVPVGMTLARKEDTVYVLDKNGTVKAQRRIPGLVRAYSTFDGLILCEYEHENDWTGDREIGCALLRQDLSWVSDRDRYFTALERVTDGITSGTRQNGEHSFRTDLYNDSAEVIFKRVQHVGTADDEAIAVCGEEYFGLIDHQGSWIAKMKLPED